MRPHTRTQCNDGKDCVECGQGGLPGAPQPPNSADNLHDLAVSLQHASNSIRNAPAGQGDSASGHQHKTDKRLECSVYLLLVSWYKYYIL